MPVDVPQSAPARGADQPAVMTSQPDPSPWVTPGFGYPMPPPRHGHSTGTVVWAVVGALIIGMLIGAGVVGGIWAFNVVPGSGATSDVSSESDEVPSASDMLPSELPDILTFVEQERGLTFKNEVDVEFLTGVAFDDAFYGPAPDLDDEPLPDVGATYAALGLTSDAETYYAAFMGSGTSGIGGFYDPVDQRLVVRGEEWTPFVEATVVHELTHALQDQHFGMAAMVEDPESTLAVRALIEGDAELVEAVYVDRQDVDWREEYTQAWADMPSGGQYDPLAETLAWLPYAYGTGLVTELDEAGALDDAFRDPPTTDEQIFYVQEWLAGDLEAALPESVDLSIVPDDAELIDEGTLGAVMLAMLPIDFSSEYYDGQVLGGWAGDSYVTWDDGDAICTDVVIRFDDADARADAAELLRAWADRGSGLRKAGDGDRDELLLHRCTD